MDGEGFVPDDISEKNVNEGEDLGVSEGFGCGFGVVLGLFLYLRNQFMSAMVWNIILAISKMYAKI